MSLESWAIDKLSVFLGFDPETLQSQILPYLMSSNSPDVFAEQLLDMVGTSDEALIFIQEFTERRFQPEIPAPAPAPSSPSLPKSKQPATSAAKTAASHSNTQSEGSFPSLPSNQAPYETMWPANISVHKKEDEYFSGLRKSKKSKNRSQNSNNNELRAAAFPADAPVKKEKKNKPNKEMTLEAALKELDIKAEIPGKKRKACQCQATKHPLLTAAPNCLSCGKIICTAEGIGPCTFCGSPVLSKEQQVALIAEAKKKRAEQKQQIQNSKNTLSNSSKQGGGTPAYASKLGGSHNPTFVMEDNGDQDRLNAELHKEKLLEFQRTSAKRSTVIDQASDFELPTDQANPWQTPQERALLLKKQQSNLRRIQRTGESSRHKVMTIDVQTKQVRVKDVDSPSSESDDEEPEVKKMDLSKKTRDDQTSAGTYSHNPLLKGITAPKFVGQKNKKSKGQLRRKERVQYDPDDIMNDYIYSNNVADDTFDPANEPITCG